MAAEDDQLIALAIQGNADALTSLLRKHGPVARQRLTGQIPARWQSVLSEDDVMQQTYADAIRDIGRFRLTDNGSFAAWLSTVARRNLLDAVKMLDADKRGGGHQRIDHQDDDLSFATLFDLLISDGTTPSRCAAKNEAKHLLELAIQKLPETYRQVIRMYDLTGRPLEEVATALRRSPGAVFMLRARAHARLREILGAASDFLSGSA